MSWVMLSVKKSVKFCGREVREVMFDRAACRRRSLSACDAAWAMPQRREGGPTSLARLDGRQGCLSPLFTL